jgi:hypothetical protein
MTLVLQAAGVFAAGFVVTRLLAVRGYTLKRLPLVGLGPTVAVIACLAAVVHGYETGSTLHTDSAPGEPVHVPGVNNAFLEWAQKRIRATAHGRQVTYSFQPAADLQNGDLLQWGTYVLLPERATSRVREADWVVLYEASAAEGRQFGPVVWYTPNFGIARRSVAR